MKIYDSQVICTDINETLEKKKKYSWSEKKMVRWRFIEKPSRPIDYIAMLLLDFFFLRDFMMGRDE